MYCGMQKAVMLDACFDSESLGSLLERRFTFIADQAWELALAPRFANEALQQNGTEALQQDLQPWKEKLGKLYETFGKMYFDEDEGMLLEDMLSDGDSNRVDEKVAGYTSWS